MANAQAKLLTQGTVTGFNLFLHDDNKPYGFYPLGDGFNSHNSTQQIQMAIGDAKDYGFDGIEFTV